jgi:hypothetical protein
MTNIQNPARTSTHIVAAEVDESVSKMCIDVITEAKESAAMEVTKIESAPETVQKPENIPLLTDSTSVEVPITTRTPDLVVDHHFDATRAPTTNFVQGGTAAQAPDFDGAPSDTSTNNSSGRGEAAENAILPPSDTGTKLTSSKEEFSTSAPVSVPDELPSSCTSTEPHAIHSAISSLVSQAPETTSNSLARTSEPGPSSKDTTSIVRECHTELSSYIKRSLSGLFSDIAQAQADTMASEDVEGNVTDFNDHTVPIHEDEVVSQTPEDCAPVRKRSRLDLEHAVDDDDDDPAYSELGPPGLEDSAAALEMEAPFAQSHPPRNDDASPSRTLNRRRSFSYQCLNQYFDIDDDDTAPSQPPPVLHQEKSKSMMKQDRRNPKPNSPRTVTGSEESPHTDEGLEPTDDAPLNLPQPPLEESESMNSFIKVLGAVDLDMDDGDDQAEDTEMAAEGEVQQHHDTAPEEDTYGWYVSEENNGAVKGSGFLPQVTPSPEPETTGSLSLLEQAAAVGDSDGAPTEDMEETPEGGEVETKQRDEAGTTDAELEYARAADTIDNVLGDFFG